MPTFTAVFLAAVALSISIRLWLAWRQFLHVSAHRGAVPAPFDRAIDLPAHQKAADYTCARTRLGAIETMAGALVLVALTLGGGLDALDRGVRALVPEGLAHGVALVAAVVALLSIVDLPFGIYRVFGLEAQFGFNRMTPRLFVVDLIKGTVLGALIGLPLVAVILWLMERAGDAWWLYAWLVWAAFNVLLLVAYPAVIAPLFNKFSPLEDEALRARVERLLARCGFRSRGLYVMDGSLRSAHGNAYFTGMGAAKRIVFFDTLLARLDPGEVEAVLAHELGHFKLRHVLKRIAWSFAVSLALFWLLGLLLEAPWFYAGLGVERPSTAMALVLFFLVLPSFTFLLQPLASHYSRRHEYEADRYAAQHADASELVGALIKLYKDNAATLTPDPLHSAYYDSHPPAALRIARLAPAPAT